MGEETKPAGSTAAAPTKGAAASTGENKSPGIFRRVVRGIGRRWREADFDRRLVAVLSILALCFFAVHFVYERPARQTAKEVVDRLKKSGSPENVENGFKSLGGEISVQEAVIDALAGESGYSVLSEGTLHLAVACLISVALVILVEGFSKRKLRTEFKESQEEIARNVWNAIFERYVPDEIVDEIRAMVTAKVVKERCLYTITLLPPYEGMPDGTFVVRRDTAYTLVNISNEDVEHPIVTLVTKSLAANYQDGTGATFSLPRYLRLLVNGEPLDTDQADLKKPVLLQENKKCVSLEPGGTCEVEVSGEEACTVAAGTTGFFQLVHLVGLTVTVVNKYADRIGSVGVKFNHPNWKQLKESPPGTFSYPGGVLPGQGFQVMWKKN